MSFGSTAIRITLIFLNILFLVIGSLVIYIGVSLRRGPDDVAKIKINSFLSLGTAVIIVGVIILVFALISFLGATTLSPGLLLVSGVSLGIPLLLCIGCFIAALIILNTSKFQKEIKENFGNSLKKNQTDLHRYEEKYKCCGCRGYVDYGKRYPKTCYKKGTRERYEADCCDKLMDLLNKWLRYCWIGAIAGTSVTILLIVMTSFLRKQALEVFLVR